MDSSINIETHAAPMSDVVFPRRDPKHRAMQDITQAIRQWRIWVLLAYQDIKLRYRRSILGPFWITMSMAITVYSMGFLYSHLFHTNMAQYYPFLVAGMLSWSLISTTIAEMSETFVLSDGLIKQIKLPYSLHIHRVASRNIMIFFHNIIVMLPIIIIFHDTIKINLNMLMLIPNLFLIYVNAVVYGLILAMIGARYRDVSQIIKSLIQVAFFVTPIMWNPLVLPESERYLVNLNPFYAFVELIREPLIGSTVAFWPFMMAIGVTLAGFSICAWMFSRYRARIIYWL